MSFDDYANHIYEKHRLAVALAVIKSKPANIPTDKYLQQLKSKVDHKMDDDDITICSDDFLMDSDDDFNDSVNILKDFDPVIVENGFKDFGDVNNAGAGGKPQAIPENLSQITYCDSLESMSIPKISNPDNDITLYEERQKINGNLDIELPNNNPNTIITGHITDTDNKFNENNDFKELVKNSNVKTVQKLVDCNKNMDTTYHDSQNTILYSVHGYSQQYTHYSASQNDIIVPNKYLYGVNNDVIKQNIRKEKTVDKNTKFLQKVTDFDNEIQFVSQDNSLNSKIPEKQFVDVGIEGSYTMNMFSQKNDDNFDNIVIDNEHINVDSNKATDIIKEIGNSGQYTQNNEIINDHINNERNMSKDDINKSQKTPNFIENSQNIDEYFDSMQAIEDDITNNSQIERNITKNYKNPADIEMIDKSLEYNQNISNNNNEIDKHIEILNISDDRTNTRDSQSENHLATIAPENNSSDQNKQKEDSFNITEEECDSKEIVSYKVLGEFNKIKTFLNRQNRRLSCDGYSTDSGYRSDSQIRSSNRSALQLSGNWLNQSGCSLFHYIMQCPLVAGTRDITNEIAQVLGQFIDRLHENEQYPSFLEEILETVNLLLQQIYEGVSTEDNEFLKNDENIQRILLLNKSIHIQKHSIEKIMNILETFHKNVTEIDSTYELSNIDEIENVSYIFHILEILLKKYLKNKDLNSQSSTQESQEDEKILKKSSITDIWRKKWNPSQKIFEGSREKTCILKNCSDILNRIVVDCVSCYSLVAYSALKCFNSMQS